MDVVLLALGLDLPLRLVAARRGRCFVEPLDVVDAKLNAAEGFDGIINWLHQAERLVAATSEDEIERTRRGIRELIEKLLSLNAEVQTIARLKRLLG